MWNRYNFCRFSSVQFSSVTQSCLTLCNPMDHSTPGLPVDHHSWSLPKLMSIESVMPSNIPSSVFPFSSYFHTFPASGSFPVSHFFTSGDQSIWSFSFSISPSNEYSGLISFSIDWFDLFVVQGTLKTLLQHQFFSAQPSLWSNSHIPT